jgi:hypothetical protein
MALNVAEITLLASEGPLGRGRDQSAIGCIGGVAPMARSPFTG